MTIQTIGAHSVALYLSPTDLRERGLAPEGLTREQALRLTREAFAREGIAVEGAVEIEAYPDLCGVLVFARFQPPKRVWFVFDQAEALIAAARALGERAPDAELTWWADRYWLSVPADAEQCACSLTEFGRPVEAAPFLDARLAEHGRTLFTKGALAALLQYFPEELA